MKIFLIRHGEQLYPHDDQGRKVVSGLDASLVELGIQQLREVGGKLIEEEQALDAIYTSPILRAKQSTEVLAKELNVSNTFLVDNLQEGFPNSAEGRTYEELEVIGGDIYAHPFSPYQETLDHLVQRTREAIKFILSDAKEKGYTSIAIIGHGDPLCALEWTMKNEGFPASYDEMKKGFYPQKGQAYEYSFSDEEPFRLTGEGKTITTEAAVSTMEGFRNPNKEVQ